MLYGSWYHKSIVNHNPEWKAPLPNLRYMCAVHRTTAGPIKKPA